MGGGGHFELDGMVAKNVASEQWSTRLAKSKKSKS